MINRIGDFLRNLRLPGIYVVLPESLNPRAKTKSAASVSESNKQIQVPEPPALVIDTSALIDGRIADIVATGFISGTIIVPSYVVDELQHVADSKSALKRNRGRRGLDVLNDLKRNKHTKFKVVRFSKSNEPVDSRLLMLAKRLKGRVITTDYNLNKVGKVSGVPILNVNELANMVKTVVLPGEQLDVTVLKAGKEKGQGVGYLPDGTMVVVENSESLIGKDVVVKVERLFQTDAGRMVFASVDHSGSKED